MQENVIIVVQRALTALSSRNAEALAAQLHADVVFESPHRTITGREQVARGATGEHYEHLTAEIIPGRIVDNGDHVLADHLTILRWRGATEAVDVSRQTVAMQLRDGLIYRIKLLDSEVLDTRLAGTHLERGEQSPSSGELHDVACTSSSVNGARWRSPPSRSGSPSRRTSNGPNTPNSSPAAGSDPISEPIVRPGETTRSGGLQDISGRHLP